MTAVRYHDVPAPDELLIDVDGYQTQTLVTVTAGQVVGHLDRHVQRDGIALVITYDIQIDGITDVGLGQAQLHIEDPANLADLADVARLLADELATATGDGEPLERGEFFRITGVGGHRLAFSELGDKFEARIIDAPQGR